MRAYALLASTALTALIATQQPAEAGTYNGKNFPYWYLGLNTQMSYVPDADISSSTSTLDEAEMDMGYALGASIGYRPMGNRGLRMELEYSYRDNDFDSFNVGGTSVTGNGDFISHNVMMNLFYDFHTSGSLIPYIGAGLGASFNDFKSSTAGVEDSDANLAYQGMVGVFYRPQTLPDTEWGIGYRYFGMTDPEMTDQAGNSLDFEHDSHNIELQTRFRF